MLWGKNNGSCRYQRNVPEASEIYAKKSIGVIQLDNVVQHFKNDWCLNLLSTFLIKLQYITYFIKKNTLMCFTSS